LRDRDFDRTVARPHAVCIPEEMPAEDDRTVARFRVDRSIDIAHVDRPVARIEPDTTDNVVDVDLTVARFNFDCPGNIRDSHFSIARIDIYIPVNRHEDIKLDASMLPGIGRLLRGPETQSYSIPVLRHEDDWPSIPRAVTAPFDVSIITVGIPSKENVAVFTSVLSTRGTTRSSKSHALKNKNATTPRPKQANIFALVNRFIIASFQRKQLQRSADDLPGKRGDEYATHPACRPAGRSHPQTVPPVPDKAEEQDT
jgi:hypothetical protein